MTEGGRAMCVVLSFLVAVILLVATGCAAPLSKVVSTRQGATMDRHLFKKGDKVKVTYEDEQEQIKTKKAAANAAPPRTARISAPPPGDSRSALPPADESPCGRSARIH